jgi:UDP-glucose 4-epimerase
MGVTCGIWVPDQATVFLNVLKAFEGESGRLIPYQIVDRRSGNVEKSFAPPLKLGLKLG